MHNEQREPAVQELDIRIATSLNLAESTIVTGAGHGS
jgi:hypothetical protein